MMADPLSGIPVLAAYRAVPSAGGRVTLPPPPPLPPGRDTVEISDEARRLAAARVEQAIWGHVRYDPPHTDDPDLPWEVVHDRWMESLRKVFGRAQADRPEAGPGAS